MEVIYDSVFDLDLTAHHTLQKTNISYFISFQAFSTTIQDNRNQFIHVP